MPAQIFRTETAPSARPSPGSPPQTSASYDEVPYEGHGIAATHPDRVAAVAALFGIETADPARCRVLELGCGRGDNLMAMATSLPGASLFGIDGSERQIAEGETRRTRAGLGNVTLRAADFTAVPEDLGEFDYIVCHGVYSWVPPETADLLLRLCRRHLAPRGIAYVSYNTYPGWHKKGMLREIMGFHVRNLTKTSDRIGQARAVAQFLARFAKEESGTHRAVFEILAGELAGADDSYVFHEYLEQYNCPVYFTEFADRAAAADLQYVGSAEAVAWDNNLPQEVDDVLSRLNSRIVREQYLDYLSNRTFRRSLLSRAGVSRVESPAPEAVRGLFASSLVQPVRPEPDIASDALEEFKTQTGDGVTTNGPLMKAALAALARRAPEFLSFEELWQLTRRLVGEAEPAACEADLAGILLRSFESDLVSLSRRAPSFALRAGERPRASGLARIQAAEDVWVTSLLHRIVELDELDRFVITHCDGTRNRADLLLLLASAVEREKISLKDSGGLSVREPERARAIGVEAIEASLERLAGKALLME